MAFKLQRLNTGDWQGKIGETVSIDVRSNQNAQTVRITYGGKVDSTAPFQFDIRSGLAALLVTALGVKNGQEVEIVEVDGTKTQILKSFFWSKQKFFDFVNVQGV